MCVLDANGQFQAINPAFEQALGYSLAELQTRSLLAFIHPEDQMASQEAIQTLAAGGGTASFTHRCRCKALTAAAGDKDTGDRWQWLTWSASAVGSPNAGSAQPSRQPSGQPSEQPSGQLSEQLLYCTAKDITARRTAEQAASSLETVLQTQTQDHAQALSTERDRYTALLKTERAAHSRAERASSKAQVYADAVRNMSIGLYIWQLENPEDSHSLKMIATNPAATDFTGLPMESVLGKYIIEAFPALIDTDIPDIYAEVARTKQPVNLGEIPYGDSQIEDGIFSVKAFPLSTNCVGISFENITERKRSEALLQQQKDNLVVVNRRLKRAMGTLQQRNEELDQFAYVTSHDLKAPLRAISSLAGWIEEDLGDRLPPENAEQFELLKSRTQRMESLINGLLKYSRAGRAKQQVDSVDTQALVQEIIESLLPLKSNIAVEITTPMPTLKADKAPLTQVFINLIDNAIKHHNKASGRIEISGRDQGDFYRFKIADNGPGIEPKYHQKIFTIFQTLRSRDDFESTGIGLAIVRKSVVAAGGEISIESEPDKGATFCFTWPKSPQQNADDSASVLG